jgi:hypothetical protein
MPGISGSIFAICTRVTPFLRRCAVSPMESVSPLWRNQTKDVEETNRRNEREQWDMLQRSAFLD